MTTPLNQPTTINGQTFYTRPCRFERNCANYQSEITFPVKIKAMGGGTKTVLRLNPCTHGGGVACSEFVRIWTKERGF